MLLKKIRHVGVVVEEFEGAIDKFRGFGISCTEVKENSKIGVKIGFLPIGDSMIELIYHMESKNKGDTVSRVVQEQKGVINHICFEVDDLEACIQNFVVNGAKLVKGCPRNGAHGRIAFFYPKTTEGILIELCEV